MIRYFLLLLICVPAFAAQVRAGDMVVMNREDLDVPSYELRAGRNVNAEYLAELRFTYAYRKFPIVYRVGEFVREPGGLMAVIRPVRMWEDARPISLKHLQVNGKKLVPGEKPVLGDDRFLVPVEYLATQVFSRRSIRSGDTVFNNDGDAWYSTGVVRAIFDNGRVMLYPTRAFTPETTPFEPELTWLKSIEKLQPDCEEELE